MQKLVKYYIEPLWYGSLVTLMVAYAHSAYALIPEIIDRIVGDFNIWVFAAAGILSIIAIIFKSTRTKIIALLSSAFALYMFYTILNLIRTTHFYSS